MKLLLFAALFIFADVVLGAILSNLRDNVQYGRIRRIRYIAEEQQTDIVIMGSSRAVHHYDPDIITEITDLSCYNAGFDGNGILLNYPLLTEITKRYSPKLIIYDLAEGFDLLARDDNHKFISIIKPFYGKYPETVNVFDDVDKTEKYKMLSKMYQYNSNWFSVILGLLPHDDGQVNGYDPRGGRIKDDQLIPANRFDGAFDDIKIKYMYKFIENCKESKVPLVFVISPYLLEKQSYVLNGFIEYCSDNQVSLWDYRDVFLNDRNLFYDGSHMNQDGASAFSEMVGERITEFL